MNGAVVCVFVLQGVVQSQFKEKMPSLFGHMVIGRDVQEEDMRGLFFGDYLSPRNTEGAPRHYDEIQDSSQLKQVRCSPRRRNTK